MGQQLVFRVAVLSVVRALARALQSSRIARMPRQWAAGEYVWRQLASDLSARIADGTYPLGSPLPAEEELASEYAVARVTVRRALAELRKRQLIKNLYGLRNAVVAMPGPGGLPG
jgi:DNA-binding GntR family transcriptional regulator